ncbi:hypothetical protein KIN20_027292, partial [Parelaphostrongylus tenuis]
MQFVTYSCGLEGEAYQIAKANCELPKPPEPTFTSLGSNNYTLIRGRYSPRTLEHISTMEWSYKLGSTQLVSYNHTYSLKPMHYKNSTMIPFLQ